MAALKSLLEGTGSVDACVAPLDPQRRCELATLFGRENSDRWQLSKH